MIDLGQRFPDRQAGSNHEPIAVVMVRFGVPLDLSGAAVTFSARSCESGVLKVNAAAGSGAANGVAQYAPTLADLDTAGIYTASSSRPTATARCTARRSSSCGCCRMRRERSCPYSQSSPAYCSSSPA